MVNEVRGLPMLLSSGSWLERTGIPAPGSSSLMDERWATATYRFDEVKAYLRAAFAQTDAFLAAATPSELARQVPSPMGGQVAFSDLLGTIALSHTLTHAGEISALKGVQGGKRLPF